MREFPESISNLKHLRYLEISKACPFKSLPSSFCCLYNLQILYAKKCVFDCLPISGFSKLINLQKFEAQVPKQIHTTKVDARKWGKKIRLINNFNQITRDLIIYNLGAISKDHAAGMELRKKEYLNGLTLRWSSLRSPEHNEIEVFQALQPPTNIKYVYLEGYPGEYLPSWVAPYNTEVPAVIVDNNNGRIGSILSSLTELSIEGCEKLSSLEQFLQPACVPAIKKIVVENCQSLISLPTARFGDLSCLEEMKISCCPNIISRSLFAPSLEKLELKGSGNLGDSIECCSLTYLHLSCSNLTSIELEKWRLPALQELTIMGCDSITFIGGRIGSIFSSLTKLSIEGCKKLSSLEQFLQLACVPAIKKIVVENCQSLVSLPTASFGDLSCLEEMMISCCPNIISQSLFAPSLEKLELKESGNLGDSIECCSLTYLHLSCSNLTSIELEKWRLPALQELMIMGCDSIKFIGGRIGSIFSSLTKLSIEGCKKLSSLEQFLQPACVPAIKKIVVKNCQSLISLPTARFGDLSCLEEMMISRCPNIISRILFAPSLEKLELIESGNLGDSIECCSLTYLLLSCSNLTSIQLNKWTLPALRILKICSCESLTFIRESELISTDLSLDRANLSLGGARSSIEKFPLLTDLTIECCNKLDTVQLLYLPAIESIRVTFCVLQTLPTERFQTFHFLKELNLTGCHDLNWESGMVLLLSLQMLYLRDCGDFSAWFTGCLENLTSLMSLILVSCVRIVSIPDHLWGCNLASLRLLRIETCPDLESIGGPEAIVSIQNVCINFCPKLKEINQPLHRGRWWQTD